MKAFISLIILATSSLVQSATLDTKTLVGTFVLKSNTINEAAAVKVAEVLATKTGVNKVFVRNFKNAKTWAIELEANHKGTKTSFQSLVKDIEMEITKAHGKDALAKKFVSSSVTWIKK